MPTPANSKQFACFFLVSLDKVPLGSMEPGETKSATIFYAAPYFAERDGGVHLAQETETTCVCRNGNSCLRIKNEASNPFTISLCSSYFMADFS